jgi:hypothetical protein
MDQTIQGNDNQQQPGTVRCTQCNSWVVPTRNVGDAVAKGAGALIIGGLGSLVFGPVAWFATAAFGGRAVSEGLCQRCPKCGAEIKG